MTLDVTSLRNTVRQLEADVARLRKLIDAQATAEAADAVELALPVEVSMPRPAIVTAYLGRHPEIVDIVTGLAADLVGEFEHEPAQIELDQYDDPEIDDHYLTFMVRLPVYPDDTRALMDRLDRVSESWGDRLSGVSGWVLVMTDFQPITVS